MTEKEEYERVPGTVIHTTEKAIFLLLDNDGEKWIPKSVCGKTSARELDELGPDDNVLLFVAEWFAKKEGIT